MSIIFNEQTKTFHLTNNKISYIMSILPTGNLIQLYFGKKVHDRADFSYLIETSARPTTTYISEEYHNKYTFTHLKQEYPVYGTTDFRHPAIEIKQANGSTISNFCYKSHSISAGKPNEKPFTYRFGGPTCLAGDIIGDYSFDKPLKVGDKVIFCDMAIYSMVKNNTFNGMPLPDIAVLHEDNTVEIIKSFGYEDFKMRLS